MELTDFSLHKSNHIRIIARHGRLGILEQRAVGAQRLFVAAAMKVDLGLLLQRLETPASARTRTIRSYRSMHPRYLAAHVSPHPVSRL